MKNIVLVFNISLLCISMNISATNYTVKNKSDQTVTLKIDLGRKTNRGYKKSSGTATVKNIKPNTEETKKVSSDEYITALYLLDEGDGKNLSSKKIMNQSSDGSTYNVELHGDQIIELTRNPYSNFWTITTNKK